MFRALKDAYVVFSIREHEDHTRIYLPWLPSDRLLRARSSETLETFLFHFKPKVKFAKFTRFTASIPSHQIHTKLANSESRL